MTSEAAFEHGDGRTVVASELPAGVGYAEVATLFAMHYDEVRREHATRSAPGLLLFAFDLGSATISHKLWTKTRPDAINAVTVGRHRECDVCLHKDPAISLRHLAVITHPYAPGARRVSFRVLDLRTTLAFRDCFGRKFEAVIADGGALLVVGRYALLLLPTGDGTRLPEGSQAGWNLIADPQYLHGGEVVTQVPEHADHPSAEAHRTSVSVIEGPARASSGLLAPAEEPLGTLEVSAAGETRRLVVGARAASQGLLIGCYERCDDDRLAHVQHTSISRVHLLVWLEGQTLYAIDTASTNGTFVYRDQKRVRTRLVRLSSGHEVVLADDRARIVWRAID